MIMDNQKQDEKVEYVEAIPIEPDHPSVETRQQPHFQTYHATSAGCSPCCGPLGCLAILVLGSGLLMNSEFFRNVLFAAFIFFALSALLSYVSRQR